MALNFNVFLQDVGHHEAAWRLPESDSLATVDVDHYIRVARLAESGGFDSIFLADSPALYGDPRYRPVGKLEPTTLLGALAVSTERIGLIATASTTYTEPYNLARAFASLDHISHGRVGWNIVTTAGDDAARNFGRSGQDQHSDRYERAAEYVEVVRALWDSWEDDAIVADKASGCFADRDRIHPVAHAGTHFRVAGPLNVPRSPQGHPVLVQAGSSSDGRSFAGRYADAVFTAQPTLRDAQDFYRDMKARARAAGRSPDHIRILPGLGLVLGSTDAEARERERRFEELIVPAYGLRQLSRMFGVDLMDADLDGPLPEVPVEDDIEGAKSRTTLVAELARRERLTVRQLLARLGGARGHHTFVGTPERLAQDLAHWQREGAADGFNVMALSIPHDLQVFVEHVVPLLRQRGLLREEYEGTTLREHYGLPRPAGRYAATAAA
jgi:FMN-dependent oxidoreductase (nitrilotriacetate monooxygenase family)